MIKVGLIFGGISNEADVSISSAKNIINNFNTNKYNLKLIYRSKDNKFFHVSSISDIDLLETQQKILPKDFKSIFDLALPITHGKFGEDGVIQSILELEEIPYSGCHVLSSSLCMNKAILKKFLIKHNIHQVKFETIDYSIEKKKYIEEKIINIQKQFQLPIYIKPSNSGSSIGITKLINRDHLETAIKDARKHDNLILIEQGLTKHIEIEVGVIGNGDIKISEPGELVKDYDFYSFDEKYINNKMHIDIPAKIKDNLSKEIKLLSEKIYRLCDCRGFARVDFFIEYEKIYFNEINTIPGFTEISAFPVLMKSTGMTYTDIIDEIISLAY